MIVAKVNPLFRNKYDRFFFGLLTFLDKRTENFKNATESASSAAKFCTKCFGLFVGSIDHIMMDSYGRSVVLTSQPCLY